MFDLRLRAWRLFPSALAFCCILNVYNLANYEISIDDEVHFWGDESVWIWWIKISRWGAALVQAVSPGSFVVPFSTNFLFCLALAATYCLLCEMHQVKKRWEALFLLPLFAIFPSFAHIESFYSVLPAVSIGLFLTACAGFMTSRGLLINPRPAIGIHGTALLLLTIAIGCYQSLLLLYLSLGIGTALATEQLSANHQNFLLSRKAALVYLLTAVASVIVYSAIGKSAQVLLNIEPSSYLDDMIPPGWYAPWNWFDNFFKGLRKMYTYYGGAPAVYGQKFYSLFALIGFGFLALGFSPPGKSVKGFHRLSLYFILLASPFAFSFLGGNLPMRSLLSLPYIVWVSSLLLLRACASRRARALVLSGFAIIFIVNVQIISINGAYAAASWLVGRHDAALASEIFGRLSRFYVANPPSGPMKLGIVGSVRYRNPFRGGDTIGASFFDWNDGDQGRMIAYMRLLGYTEVAPLEDEEVKKLKAKIEAMPEWPAQESIARVGPDSFIVKLRQPL